MQRALVAIALGCVTATACVRVSTTHLATAQASVPIDSVRVFATQSPGDYTSSRCCERIASSRGTRGC